MSFGSDRTVSVTLKAVTAGYVSDLKSASSATSDFAKNSEKSSAAHSKAMTQVGTGMLVAGAAIAAGIGLAVKSYADFDKELSQVKAVSGATASEMNSLSNAALKAGADTKYSASEAANAIGELAKVGISVKDILGGALTGALNLAAAGSISLADAATISGQAMKIFKLEGSDVPRIADALANGANKSAADVTQLGQALQQAGLLAAQTGLTLEDTVGTLALFADNALIGSDAGTSLKTMLTRLNPSTEEASTAMRDLGLNFYDASGKFVGIEASAGLLRDRLGNLSDQQRQSALSTIFGSDAIRAATILYDQGAAGVRTYVEGVKEQGAAARVAAINMDNLSGDIEQLKGSIETGLIRAGSSANGVLRDLVQGLTGAVNTIAGLPGPVQSVGIGLAAVAAAGLLAGGAFLTLIPKIAATKVAMVELGITSTLVKSLLGGPWGIALAAATIGLGFFIKGQLDAKQRADDLRASLDQQTGAITDNTRQMVANQLQQKGVFELAKTLGVSLKDVTDAALGQGDALDRLRSRQEQLTATATTAFQSSVASGKGLEELTGKTDMFGRQVQTSAQHTQAQAQAFGSLFEAVGATSAVLNPQIEAQKQIADATGTAKGATEGLTKAQLDQVQSADANKKALVDLKDAVKNYGDEVASARDANRGYEASLDAASESLDTQRQKLADSRLETLKIKDATDAQKASALQWADAQIAAGAGLDISTDAGRRNATALDGIAQKAKDAAVANFNNGVSVADVTAKMGTARTAFVDQATKMGMTSQAANTLADKLGLTSANVGRLTSELNATPRQTTARVDAETAAAQQNVQATAARLDAIDGRRANTSVSADVGSALAGISQVQSALGALRDKTITLTTNRLDSGTVNPGVAGGGYISGPGTSTSDSIPAYLSNGEYVVKAAAVARYGMTFFHQVNAMRFADGGGVGRVPPALRPADPITSGPVTFNAYGNDSEAAMRKALQDWEFQRL